MIDPTNDDSTMVILGIPESKPVSRTANTSASESRIGGVPSWHDERKLDTVLWSIRCGRCRRQDSIIFIGQFFAPTDTEDRSLYIFACNTRSCSLTSDGWIVLRNQTRTKEVNIEPIKPLETKQTTKPTSTVWNFLDDKDDNDTNENNEDDEDLSELMGMLSARDQSLTKPQINSVQSHKGDAHPTGLNKQLPEVSKISIYDSMIKETFPCYLIDDLDDPYTENHLTSADEEVDDDDDEDEADYERDAEHIAELLSSYMSAEEDITVVELLKNLQEKKINKEPKETSTMKPSNLAKVKGSHDKEEHLDEDDHSFDHRLSRDDQRSKTELFFQKVISYSPKQIMRYAYCGKPLWCTYPYPSVDYIKPCELCGKQRVFELQLMPALLSIWSEYRCRSKDHSSIINSTVSSVDYKASTVASPDLNDMNENEESDKVADILPINRPTESQLASFLSTLDDGLDFGTVAIYCCPDGCSAHTCNTDGSSYPDGCYVDDMGITWREVVVVQHPSDIA